MLLIIGFFYDRNFLNQDFFREKQIETWNRRVENFENKSEFRNGDIIFQTSLSNQSKAIQLATNSKYSHCGIIFNENRQFYVLEAVQPVKKTLLEKWIARGDKGHFVVKRLINADEVLTPEILIKMKIEGERFLGKNYDLTFEWSDDKIYCSELIWKIYERATGLEIGQLEKLSDFDLTNKVVKSKLNERYGEQIPRNETVISPAAIFESELLKTVEF
uniref:YiiX family permuted papain-like enzyme n=2 Tax=Flavobacterium sp. TaxID=239 RepID=UPI00404ABC97